jgi:hypothetical protein
MGPLGADLGPEMASLLVKACSASVQDSSPSAQIEASAAQVGDRIWSGEKFFMFDYRVS